MLHRFYPLIPSALIISASLFLFSCAILNDETSEAPAPQSYQHVFTSVGYAPIAAQKGSTFELQMLYAIKASKLDAYKELAEQIYGVLLNSENQVSGSLLQDSLVESRVKGLIRGARVLKSYHDGGMYITELELNMENLAFLRAPEFNEVEPQPVVEQAVYY